MTSRTSGEKEKAGLVLRAPLSPDGAKRGNAVRDFIYGSWCNGRRIGGTQMPPLNEIYIATVLKENGLPALFLDADVQTGEYRELADSGFNSISSLILMVSTASFTASMSFLEQVRQRNPECKTIIYGSHPTFMPSYCLDNPAVDYIIMGEPEFSILELVKSLWEEKSVEKTPGLGYRGPGGEQRMNAVGPFCEMDDLPMPDRTLLPRDADYFNPVVKRVPYTTAQTSRGCPSRCVFCTAPSFYGGKTRFRSAEKVLEELRVIAASGYREVFFRDESFTAFRNRNIEIFEKMISEKIDISWIANSRVDMIDRDMVKLMKRAGCHMIKLGVESGSEEMLGNYRKGATVKQCEEAFGIIRGEGLDTHAHMILGGPGETPETIDESVRFAIKLKPTSVTFGLMVPYPGTEIFNIVKNVNSEIMDGSVFDMDSIHVNGMYSEALCGLSEEYLSGQVVRAYRRFYLRPRYILSRLFALRDMNAFYRTLIGGLNVIQYALSGKK